MGRLSPVVLISLVVLKCAARDTEYKMNNIPDFNFCVYSLEPLTVLVDCFLGRLPKDFAEEFASTVQEVFGGIPVAEGLKFVCKNNNDDGQMLLETWLDELAEEYRPKARLAVWVCIEQHEDIVQSSA